MNLMQYFMLAACRRFWRLYGLANFLVDLDGLKIPIAGHSGLAHLEYRDPQFQTLIKAALAAKPDGHFVDIGANIGRFLLNLIHLDRSRSYLGIEPLLPAAAYVRRLIVANGLRKHEVVPIAFCDRHGTTTIRFSGEDDVSASISEDMRPVSMYPNQQLVATATGDSVLAHLPSIAFVKLDVEGTEIDVLRGMQETIRRHRPPFLVEVMPYAYLLDGTYNRDYFGDLPAAEARRIGENRHEHCIALNAFFRELDYVFHSCTASGELAPVNSLDRGNSREAKTDFLLLPASESDEFLAHVGH